MIQRFMGLSGGRRRGSAAFTLVELLIALLVTAVALTAVYGMFFTGLRAWRRGTNQSRMSFEVGFLSDVISRDLRSAMDPENEQQPALLGDRESVAFFTTSSTGGGGKWPLRFATYSYEHGDEATLGRLTVTSVPYAGTAQLVEAEGREVIAANVEEFQLSYYKDNRWQDKWQDDGLPEAVRIIARLVTDDRRRWREIDLVVDLPCYVKKGS